jgi:hypothetical protein
MLLNVGGECPETPHRSAPKRHNRKSRATNPAFCCATTCVFLRLAGVRSRKVSLREPGLTNLSPGQSRLPKGHEVRERILEERIALIRGEAPLADLLWRHGAREPNRR